jgi:hypothetical protein
MHSTGFCVEWPAKIECSEVANPVTLRGSFDARYLAELATAGCFDAVGAEDYGGDGRASCWLSINPPTMAVFPSPDSETDQPCCAPLPYGPTAPVPTSFAPCWLHTSPERVNTQAAPALVLSRGPPRIAVLVLLLYQKGRDSPIFQAQDRAIDDFTLKGICAGIILIWRDEDERAVRIGGARAEREDPKLVGAFNGSRVISSKFTVRG